jgi:predicted nuclease of predicted toxin-antitoxin system
VSAPRFLVDENLSIRLPEVAHARGYEATHINHYGLRRSKDWDIVAEEDWVLITNNAFEFRGRYQRLEVHPGVVFLIPNVPRIQQIELFSAALDTIAGFPDVVNTAIDVAYEAGHIRVSRYALPDDVQKTQPGGYRDFKAHAARRTEAATRLSSRQSTRMHNRQERTLSTV